VHTKAKAVIEVVIVFSLTLAFVALVGLSPLGRWERTVTNRVFIEYAVMIAFPLLLLVATRRNLASYGLSLRHLPYHLWVTAVAFVPMAIAFVPFGFISYTQWSGALIMTAVQIVLLFALGWLLKRFPTRDEKGMVVGAVALLACPTLARQATVGNALSAFVFYILFLGLGEELLFRGYIQSRLNAAWGKPFRFFGVRWGWGVVITSALFGLMHVLNVGGLPGTRWQLEWWWGLWTFFGGLVLGFVREKTGSIVAPTLLHGLPQALTYAILGL
jgi:membrane protease YdiL (CAAX protease family)